MTVFVNHYYNKIGLVPKSCAKSKVSKKYDKLTKKEHCKMARKNYTVEQIVVKLREVELFCG